jgi:hypothetical protein
VPAIALQIDAILDALLPIDMMTASCPFLKAQPKEQSSQLIEVYGRI